MTAKWLGAAETFDMDCGRGGGRRGV